MRATVLSILITLALAACPGASATSQSRTDLETATFALGCYWCGQHAFDGIEGVEEVTAGHAGEGTARREAVRVRFDPETVSYEKLLEHFWLNHDPFDPDGQFCDQGSNYRPGIFVHTEEQRRIAEESKEQVSAELGREVVTRILDPHDSFEPVRESEQFYYEKNPVRYRVYRTNCGRDARLHEVWGERAGGTLGH
ncbi:MAG: peptide-methionine (S)-S-oxide reductase [Thermoanaerobaculia bacterium]|nr:peptide-methionine (S)-S-oxide reductase [Thermoanaerobaculia bacterium]